jgi:hypothetical protein
MTITIPFNVFAATATGGTADGGDGMGWLTGNRVPSLTRTA